MDALATSNRERSTARYGSGSTYVLASTAFSRTTVGRTTGSLALASEGSKRLVEGARA